MRSLTPDEVAQLLKEPTRDNYPDYIRNDVETFECSICGCCETPEACVWSVVCPICGAGISDYCRTTERIVTLHQERHDLALIRRTVKGGTLE